MAPKLLLFVCLALVYVIPKTEGAPIFDSMGDMTKSFFDVVTAMTKFFSGLKSSKKKTVPFQPPPKGNETFGVPKPPPKVNEPTTVPPSPQEGKFSFAFPPLPQNGNQSTTVPPSPQEGKFSFAFPPLPQNGNESTAVPPSPQSGPSTPAGNLTPFGVTLPSLTNQNLLDSANQTQNELNQFV